MPIRGIAQVDEALRRRFADADRTAGDQRLRDAMFYYLRRVEETLDAGTDRRLDHARDKVIALARTRSHDPAEIQLVVELVNQWFEEYKDAKR